MNECAPEVLSSGNFSPSLSPWSLWEQAHTYFHSFYLLTGKAGIGEQVEEKHNLAETLRENEFHRP